MTLKELNELLGGRADPDRINLCVRHKSVDLYGDETDEEVAIEPGMLEVTDNGVRATCTLCLGLAMKEM